MTEGVRPWVRRLGSYLRIFGPPARDTLGSRTDERDDPLLDRLIEKAKEREAEFGPPPPGEPGPPEPPRPPQHRPVEAKRSDISDLEALEACKPWGGEHDDRPWLAGLSIMENDSALQRLQHAGWPFKVALRKLEQLDGRGWIDYGVSINYPWRTEEGEAELARLRGSDHI